MPKKREDIKLQERIIDIDERKVALEKALKQIEKDFGKGSIMRLGEKADIQIAVSPTGSMLLDAALGVGGYPKGRIIEVYGAESSGKTTLTLHAIAEMQKTGGVCAFIDAEHALDPAYAQKLGVNTDELLISQPDNGEQALEIADALVRSGAIDMLVVDSVAALVPKAEIEGAMGDAHMALQARLMSQALRKLSGQINAAKTIAIFINQIRVNIGAYAPNGQVPTTTAGGRALKFYSTIRLEVKKSEQIKESSEVIGNKTKIKVVKNKVAPPFKTVELDLIYGQGISAQGEIVTLGVEFELIEKRGSWYSYKGEKIGQGTEVVRAFFAENPDIAAEVEANIRDILKNGGMIGEHAVEQDDEMIDDEA
ncbi:MAG: recombinase RecA [Defluviitaleaceae bacterium]|nr:recombinase RecA [Defluviitaleaceae bacterium]